MSNELAQQILAVKEQLQLEIREGGSLKDSPCPFCGLPRCLRSNYVRCQKCGVNWWEETDLTRNPHAKPALTGSMILRLVNGMVVPSQPTRLKPSMSEGQESAGDLGAE